MPVDPHPPFKKSQLAPINRALADLTEAEKTIERAKAAGFDMSAQEQDCKSCRKCLQGVVDQFFTRRAGE